MCPNSIHSKYDWKFSPNEYQIHMQYGPVLVVYGTESSQHQHWRSEGGQGSACGSWIRDCRLGVQRLITPLNTDTTSIPDMATSEVQVGARAGNLSSSREETGWGLEGSFTFWRGIQWRRGSNGLADDGSVNTNVHREIQRARWEGRKPGCWWQQWKGSQKFMSQTPGWAEPETTLNSVEAQLCVVINSISVANNFCNKKQPNFWNAFFFLTYNDDLPIFKSSLEKEMVPHSSILAWRIPWTEEPGGLHSSWHCRVGHDWVNEHTFLKVLLIWIPVLFLGGRERL